MENKESYDPKVGDYVTVVKWIGSTDKSYTRDVLQILCINSDLIHCQFITRNDFIILSTKQVELRGVAEEFVQSIIGKNKKC